MTLQQLAYFLTPLETGSFSAAAVRRRLAQPSLSKQIRRREDELGVASFARVSPAVREFMVVAEERMRAVAAAVEAQPARGRRPGA